MPKKQKLIDGYVQISRPKIIISEDDRHLVQAAISGMSLHQIINSDLIKTLFAKNGWKLPSSQTTLKDRLLAITKQIKSLMKQEIKDLKSEGKFFSVCLDEWTSISNVRFMNVYLTFIDGSYNLGLQELSGHLTSETLINSLSIKLNDFGLELSEIIGITSDGASVMLKLQKYTNCFSQICLAHGIHLSIKDSLISKNTEASSILMQSSSDDEESVTEQNIYHPNYKLSITKMMKVINKFSHSGLLVNKLNEYRSSAGKKCLKIITHSKIRWNSLFRAIERFLILWPEIQKVFIDISVIGLL